MIATKEQIESFREAAKPLVEWLNEHCHPHTSVIVTPVRAELVEGVICAKIEEFLRD